MKTPKMRKALKAVGAILALLLGILLIGGGLFALEILSRQPQQAIHSTTHEFLDRRGCLECHAPIADEWRGSYHYRSLTGPYWKEVQQEGYVELFNKLRKACINCHAPANILDLGQEVSASVGSAGPELGIECTPNLLREPRGIIPAARSDDVELGVDCVSCHVSRHGITGSGRRPTAEHENIPDQRFQDPAFTSTGFCSTCHRSIVDAWKKTKFANEGITCLDCHMPLVEAPSVAGGPERLRRSHGFPADKDETMLKKAMNATLDITGDRRARLRITNDRVGHHLPSGANWLLVYLRAYDLSGQLVSEHKEALGREEALLLDFWPFIVDKRIPFGGQKEILLSLPAGHGRVEAMVRYHDWMRQVKTVVTLKENY